MAVILPMPVTSFTARVRSASFRSNASREGASAPSLLVEHYDWGRPLSA